MNKIMRHAWHAKYVRKSFDVNQSQHVNGKRHRGLVVMDSVAHHRTLGFVAAGGYGCADKACVDETECR